MAEQLLGCHEGLCFLGLGSFVSYLHWEMKRIRDKFDVDPIMQIANNIYKNLCFCVFQKRLRTIINK
jgi:hypothetical protein